MNLDPTEHSFLAAALIGSARPNVSPKLGHLPVNVVPAPGLAHKATALVQALSAPMPSSQMPPADTRRAAGLETALKKPSPKPLPARFTLVEL